MREKYKSRKYCILLYPNEDKTHKKALDFIKLNYDYALIEHNQDKDENGEIKKSHTHIVISFPNAKWNTAIANDLGITINYIEKCRDMDKALEYLIHYNDDTKHQYDIEEVHGSLKYQLKKILLNDGKDENVKAFELIQYIKEYEGYISFTNFAEYACEIGMYDVARRSSYLLGRIIEEHNTKYDYKKKAYNNYEF